MLDAAPAEEVEVAVRWNEDKAVTANPAVLTFTTSDWAAAQTVTVSATPDADADGFKATLRHEATGSDYEFAPEANVKVTVTDSDMVGVTINPPELVASPPQTLVVEEGGSNAYTLQLATEPGGPVTINVAPKAGSDARLGASPSSLVFTSGNWSVPQTVTVTAAPDPQVVEATATIVHTLADPGAYGSLTIPEVTVREDDTDAKLVVTGPATIAEGASGDFTVALNGQPDQPVTVAASVDPADDVDGGADRTDLHDRQLVDGADRDRHHRIGRRHARRRAGGPLRGLRRYLRRRRPRGIRGRDGRRQVVTLSVNALTVPEGDSASYTVSLGGAPAGNITVDITRTGDADFQATPSALTFTTDNWNTKTVTVSAAQDGDGHTGGPRSCTGPVAGSSSRRTATA